MQDFIEKKNNMFFLFNLLKDLNVFKLPDFLNVKTINLRSYYINSLLVWRLSTKE